MPGAAKSLFSLVFVVIFVRIIVVIVFQEVAVFIKIVLILVGVFLLFLFVFFLFDVIGNGVEGHGMGLRNFQFALTLRAAQDLSLFHFVFVHINFCGTFGTAKHVSILRFEIQPVGFRKARTHQPAYYIPGF
jgi:hypothetical protein